MTANVSKGSATILGEGKHYNVVSTAPYPFRNMASNVVSVPTCVHLCVSSSFISTSNSSEATEDPQTDLTHCIPLRIYGDGAEAQRSLEQNILYMYTYISIIYLYIYMLYIYIYYDI